MFPLRCLLPAALLLLVSATPAASVIITFEETRGLYDPDHPGGGEHGPYDWLEDGARYSGFWLTQVGTPQGGAVVGHTHLGATNYGGRIGDAPHSWVNDLQGGVVTLLGGGAFDLISIDYRIVSRETAPNVEPWTYFEQRLPWSQPVEAVQLLLATDIDPVAPDFATFESQFTAFDIDDGTVFDLGGGAFDWRRPAADVMLRTIDFTGAGFENLTQLYLTHTGNFVVFDNIVIAPHAVPTPEPGTGVLVAVGLGVLGVRRRRGRDRPRGRGEAAVG